MPHAMCANRTVTKLDAGPALRPSHRNDDSVFQLSPFNFNSIFPGDELTLLREDYFAPESRERRPRPRRPPARECCSCRHVGFDPAPFEQRPHEQCLIDDETVGDRGHEAMLSIARLVRERSPLLLFRGGGNGCLERMTLASCRRLRSRRLHYIVDCRSRSGRV
jgi:hypothetical protein